MMYAPARVMQVVPSTGFGGISSMVMNAYRRLDKSKIQFDFVAFNRGEFHDEIVTMGGRVYYVDLIKKQGPIAYIRSMQRLMTTSGPFKAIHVHNGYHGSFALMSAKLAGIDTRICHVHTTNVEQRWHKFMVPFLNRVAMTSSTVLLACSEEAGRFMYGKREFRIMPNAFDTTAFTILDTRDAAIIRKELDVSSNQILVGHVGRFSAVKNHEFMLQIASKLIEQHLDFRMVLVGDGPLLPEIKEMTFQKGLAEYVIFTGRRSDIPRLMNAFNVFLFPSIFEGLPVALLEAQACGIPCLVSASVSRDADMGIGNVSFLDLAAGSEMWASELRKMSASGRANKQDAAEKLARRGYDVSQNVKELMGIYRITTEQENLYDA